jgi:hypothetical protein
MVRLLAFAVVAEGEASAGESCRDVENVMRTEDGLVVICVAMRRKRESIAIALLPVGNPEHWAIPDPVWPEYPNRREWPLHNGKD